MFSIIEVLQTFHTQFLSDFESRMKELENSGNSVAELCVSDIFIKSVSAPGVTSNYFK